MRGDPPVPPCNPGRLGESRTVRDGDAKGVFSPRDDVMTESDNVGPRVSGLGPHDWSLPCAEDSTEEEEGTCTPRRSTPERLLVVPPIPPCNPGRQDESQTVREGDAEGGASRGDQVRRGESNSPSWEALVAEADNSGGYTSTEQDESPDRNPVGGRSWAGQAENTPEAAGPSDPMLRVPPADREANINRDHDSWRESLRQELVLTQGYFVGWDSLEFLDFRHGQLSREHKALIDTEYDGWIKLELGSAHKRKGPRRRTRRQEAAVREEATGPAAPMSKKKRRRADYARVQMLYRANRSECSRKIVSGEWQNEAPPGIPLDDQVSFWSRVFGEESQVDERVVRPQGMVLWSLVRAITADEIFAALRKSKQGAAGLDKISRDDIRKLDPRALLAHFNLWLYAGYQPAEFRRSRTVLIPKVPDPSGPGEFRPIAISSYVSRVFHRLLAGRLSGLLEFNSRQRAFVKGDGIADNVFLLRCMLRDRCDALQPLSVAFLDVSKAFDSVSHASLLLAAERMGVPGPFISYLRSLYTEASTVLQVDGHLSGPLVQNRGVKQGDPLTPLLFNCVIDWALASLDPEVGVVAGEGPRLNHLAFADDVVIICQSSIGCQHLCRQFEKALGRCGLRLNADKSRTLQIAVNGKAKKWVCDPNPFLSLAGGVLPAIPISLGYKYLGVTISARERDATPEEILRRGMNQLTVAPLKHQQRLFFLRVNLLPKLHHRLVLSRSRGGVLRQMDKLIRRGVRNWLRLPHDATNAFIHAEVKDGGLGIPSLRATIPFMKRDRLKRLATSSDPMISHMVANSGTFKSECVNCSRPPVRVGPTVVNL